MAYLFSAGGAPKTNLSDCRYEEEQELQQVAFRFMKKRDKERKAKELKERAKVERERIRAQQKALKALQKSNPNKKSVVFPVQGQDIQMAEGAQEDDGNCVKLCCEEHKAVG
ncbi:uncharacterized protein LOC121880160 [Homarus americanus]|uniref:uncharacterized protein LOC121880160 n=1 Tax=Homarus americanus TaxID=6706 RepID=UPI001C495FA0|nr:uncharacterized protein LOC121880160 [Homarus americanus]